MAANIGFFDRILAPFLAISNSIWVFLVGKAVKVDRFLQGVKRQSKLASILAGVSWSEFAAGTL